jgi:hypothetical protein
MGVGRLQMAFGLLVTTWLAPLAARATVAEQRERLPPPAQCQDRAEGVWQAHQYAPREGKWYIFTLEIRHESPGSAGLTGTIRAEFWRGTTADEQPPQCESARGGYHHAVRMPAQGTLAEDDLTFGGLSYTWERDYCGSGHGRYNVDHFAGRIDSNLQEFQSVNNDGVLAVNDPTLFRRIRCLDGTVGPSETSNAKATPPPSFEKKGRASCQCAQAGRRGRSGSRAAVSFVAAAGALSKRRARRRDRDRPERVG